MIDYQLGLGEPQLGMTLQVLGALLAYLSLYVIIVIACGLAPLVI